MLVNLFKWEASRTKMGRIRFGVILAILAMVVVSSACIPVVEPMPTPKPTPSTPGTNQVPVILSLRPAQTQAYPSGIIEIQYAALDPDGDSISYEWSTTGGKFKSIGDTVFWEAPEYYGTYDVALTVKDGRGGVAREKITLNVAANQVPQVLRLVANPAIVLPQGRSLIICVATDPDGNVLNYSWQASDGSITGLGDTVTWVAPDREGEFIITVTVDDGKGGQNGADVSVTVALPEKTIMLTLLPNESGTISSAGDQDNSKLIAGDNDKDIGYRTFFSFDISSLKGADIKDAKLTFRMGNVFGDPFSREWGLGGLRLWCVRGEYGQLPDYDTQGAALLGANSIMWELPTVIDVTQEVKGALLSPDFSIHLQFEARFLHPTDHDHWAEYVSWSGATLTVTYVER